eukprot:3418878-Pyramimonas_sp.AAC.1
MRHRQGSNAKIPSMMFVESLADGGARQLTAPPPPPRQKEYAGEARVCNAARGAQHWAGSSRRAGLA